MPVQSGRSGQTSRSYGETGPWHEPPVIIIELSDPMSENERRLLELLKARSFKRGQFRLASGGTSDYFIDGKMTEVYSEGAYLIGEVLYELTRDLEIDAIGGLQVGAVPLTTATVISYHHHGQTMEGFWVREEVKSHGTQKKVEGVLRPGTRVAIVDDVFTKGGSALKAIEAVRDLGCEVVLVLALVDRLQGAEELFRQNGVENYRAVFTIRDFGVGAEVRGETETATR
jgi:orotate phosphoribosyltransferase